MRRWIAGILVAFVLLGGVELLIAGIVLASASFFGIDLLRLATPVRDEVLAWQGQISPQRANTANDVPIAYADMRSFGINTFLDQEVEDWKIRRTLEMIRNAGFTMIRQQFPWNYIEPTQKGEYWDYKNGDQSSWVPFDRLVALAQEYGIEIVARLDYPPAWARSDRTWAFGPPDRFEDYGDFVYAVVNRYRGKVRFYQIWNEPNLSNEWGRQSVDPASYVQLLRIAYTRAKEADPHSVIIAAALAPTIEEGPVNLNDIDFLRGMYEAGGKDYFDIASFNPYGLWWGPDDRRVAMDRTNFSRPLLAREVMVENGDAQKPVWASEFGWPAVPQGWPEPITHGQVTREQQADYLVRGYQRALEEWPWMGPMFLWHFRMVSNEFANQQAYYFNIVDNDFQPLPAYNAVASLANSEPTVYPGYRQESYWALQYVGDWQQVEAPQTPLGAYRRTTQPGAQLTFRFVGRDLDLVVHREPDGGQLEVTIDGQPSLANRLPQGGGTAKLNLASPSEAGQVRVPIAQGLPNQAHVAELRVSSPGMVAIGAVVVGGPPLGRIWPLATAVALLLAVAAVWISQRRLLGSSALARYAPVKGAEHRQAPDREEHSSDAGLEQCPGVHPDDSRIRDAVDHG
ncbi:MAG: cellulase family glycosylhydrolase [Chloroflexi bacterium]|nr:cellulase family glycosylhydrolase [Chloroflexota bacterium]